MTFLDFVKRVPGTPIGLRVFKKEFQIRSGDRRIVFDEEDHVPSCPLHLPPKVVITLGRICRENAPFTERFGQEGFEGTHFIMLGSDWTLL
jgi:hypothetical protein